jgi:hypothetical protein
MVVCTILLPRQIRYTVKLEAVFSSNENAPSGSIFASAEEEGHGAGGLSPARYAGGTLLLHRSNLVSHIGRLYVQYFLSTLHNELTFEALVVSCAQSPISSLQGESISIIQNPATESATTLSQNILIYSKNSLVWSLPVDECQGWFVSIYTIHPGFDVLTLTRPSYHISGNTGHGPSRSRITRKSSRQKIGPKYL